MRYSLLALSMAHLREIWPREVADPGRHMRPNGVHWRSIDRRCIRERQSHRTGVPDELYHQPPLYIVFSMVSLNLENQSDM